MRKQKRDQYKNLIQIICANRIINGLSMAFFGTCLVLAFILFFMSLAWFVSIIHSASTIVLKIRYILAFVLYIGLWLSLISDNK